MKSVYQRRGGCAVAAACALFVLSPARGSVSLDSSSTAKILHYAEQDNGGAFSSKNVNPPPTSGSMPLPGSYQYSKTLNLNGGSSSASASIGAITNSANVGFTFASGTGITQSDPSGHSFDEPAILKFNVNGIWDVNSRFGPTAYGYIAFTLAGNVPSGDTASVNVDLKWTNSGGTNLRSPLNQTVNFTHSSSFPYTFSNASVLNTGSVNSGQIKVTGTITFSASDPGATVSFQPLDFEMSAAPPTYFFKDVDQNYTNQENWGIDSTMAQDFPSPIPNQPGVRAYFGQSPTSSETEMDLNAPATLGDLDINRAGLTIQGLNSLTFDTQDGNAVLFCRNTNNFNGVVNGQTVFAAETLIAAPVVLNKPLEVIIDSEEPLLISDDISGTGGIIKSGLGELVLSNLNNTFTGGVTVNAGTITIPLQGALGSNTVNVSGGAINILTQQPFTAGGGTIGVQSNSQVSFGGGISGTTGVDYNIATFGAISGTGTQLSSLTFNSNYFPQPNSMISHVTDFNTGPSGNPSGISFTTPKYIFGIGSDFPNGQDITVGLGSVSAWSGFGGDLASHTIGASTTALSPAIVAAGTTQLVALGGLLSINQNIKGINNPAIIKNGAGVVAINSLVNTFTGPTEVQTGPLAINGVWNSNTTVDPGATLGGSGTINGSVTFLDPPANPNFFQPGLMGGTASGPTAFTNTTIFGPGTLHTGDITFSPDTHLVFDLDDPSTVGGFSNDLLIVNGNLTLDGILDITDGQDFTNGVYTLIQYTGALTDNGLILGNFDLEAYPNAQIFNIPNAAGTGGSIVIAVPEPAMLGLFGAIAIAFARRSRVRECR